MVDTPVAQIHRLRDELGQAVARGKWKTSRNRARSITKLLALAMDPSTCGGGTPHIDGVFSVGTQSFTLAPERTKVAIDEMNEAIKTCREKLHKKKKKRKKR